LSEALGITFEEIDRAGVVTLDRPRRLNALNREMFEALSEHYRRWAPAPHIYGVVMQSSHPSVFSTSLSFPKIPSDLDSSSSRRKGSKFSADLHEANAPLVRCYAPWGSLFARKFSLLWRLGNSVRKQLNFLPKAGAPWSSRARKRRISLYFPLEQGIQRAETGSPMTASSATT
jgi:hypothetical protein